METGRRQRHEAVAASPFFPIMDTERVTVKQLADELREFAAEQKNNYRQLQQQIQLLHDALQNQVVMEAKREHTLNKVEMHHRSLYGDPDKNQPGHSQRITKLEEQMSTLIKILWIVVTPLLAGIGAGVLWLIRMSGMSGQ